MLAGLVLLISGFLVWVVISTDGAVEAYREMGASFLEILAPGKVTP